MLTKNLYDGDGLIIMEYKKTINNKIKLTY